MELETKTLIQLVAVTGALLQMAKNIPIIEKFRSWLPVASVALGIVLAYVTNVPDPIVPGIMVGLAASGGYSFLKQKNNKKAMQMASPLN